MLKIWQVASYFDGFVHLSAFRCGPEKRSFVENGLCDVHILFLKAWQGMCEL